MVSANTVQSNMVDSDLCRSCAITLIIRFTFVLGVGEAFSTCYAICLELWDSCSSCYKRQNTKLKDGDCHEVLQVVMGNGAKCSVNIVPTY